MSGLRRPFTALLLALTLCERTEAQEDKRSRADAVFRDARRHLAAGNYELACARFEESFQLDPAVGSAINIGDCLERRGKLASALQVYRFAYGLLKPRDPRASPVLEMIQRLEGRSPKVQLRVESPASVEVRIKLDGNIVDTREGELFVDPGPHEVEATADGYIRERYRVLLAEGQRRIVTVDLERESAPLPTRYTEDRLSVRGQAPRNTHSPRPSSVGGTQTLWGYLLVAAGIAGLGTSVAYWKMATDTHQAPCPSGDCRSLNEREHDQRAVANVAGVAGGVSVLAGLTLVLTSGDPGKGTTDVRVSTRAGLDSYWLKAGGHW